MTSRFRIRPPVTSEVALDGERFRTIDMLIDHLLCLPEARMELQPVGWVQPIASPLSTRRLIAIKNHPVVAALIVFGIIVMAVAPFLTAARKIFDAVR